MEKVQRLERLVRMAKVARVARLLLPLLPLLPLLRASLLARRQRAVPLEKLRVALVLVQRLLRRKSPQRRVAARLH